MDQFSNVFKPALKISFPGKFDFCREYAASLRAQEGTGHQLSNCNVVENEVQGVDLNLDNEKLITTEKVECLKSDGTNVEGNSIKGKDFILNIIAY